MQLQTFLVGSPEDPVRLQGPPHGAMMARNVTSNAYVFPKNSAGAGTRTPIAIQLKIEPSIFQCCCTTRTPLTAFAPAVGNCTNSPSPLWPTFSR